MSDRTQPSASAPEIFGSDRMWGLKELPLPEQVSWWPQTPGWYVLEVILLCLLAWFGWKFWQRYQRNAYRRTGLKKLESVAADSMELEGLPRLLRISALQSAPRTKVAGLRGDDWIAWLNESSGRELFEKNDAEMLENLAFAGQQDRSFDNESARRLVEASKIWMRSHRASV